MQNYKDLLVWRKSHELTLIVYKTVSTYPKEETYSLVSQLKRASSSIATNIAEGTGRFSQKDLAHFLQMSLGSSHEVEYLLLLSKDLGFINNETYIQLERKSMRLKLCSFL